MTDPGQVLAANLRRYRSAHGLSQQALADAAGLSRIGYRDVEAGTVSPRAETLAKLAVALGVRLEDLFVPIRTLTHVRFRAHKRMAVRGNILASAARWLDDYRELEEVLDDRIDWTLAPTADEIQRLPPGIARARQAARLARQALGLERDGHEELIRDVSGLLEDNGVKVLSAAVKSEGFFGLSIAAEDAGPAVFVNTWDRISVERWIFTAVHELGHLLMHPGAFDVSNAEENEAEEKEADTFAGYFLMPQSLFEKEWNEARGLGLVDRVFKIKRIFRVSWQTVVYRVAGPLERVEREAVWQRFEKQYERKVGRPVPRVEEPEGLDPDAFRSRPVPKAADEPARLGEDDFCEDRLYRLVRAAIENQKITMSRAAEILGLSLKEMRELAGSWVE